jgi:flagellar biogenesis protein FliO
LLYIPIILGSIIVVYLKLFENKKLTAIFQGFVDLRAFRRVIREETIIKGWSSNLLLINTVLVVSTAVTYSLFAKYDVAKFGLNMYAIFGITALILVGYYWFRKILFFMIGFFSEQPFIANEINTYNRFYYQALGIVLLPILYFANFRLADSDITWLAFFYNGLFLLLQIILILSYLFKLVQEFRQTTQINISGYYLFLYFCTLEILPLVVFIVWFIGKK